MWYILDLLVIAIVLFFVISSAKKGFAKTFIELIGFAVSIYLAFFVGNTIATSFYDKTVEPAVIKTIISSVEDTAGESVDDAVDEIWIELPKIVTNSASHFGVGPETIRENINSGLSEKINIQNIAENTSQKVLKPVIVPILKTIIGIAVFTVLMFVVRFLAKIINKVFKLPIIGGLNSALGGVIGFGKGIIISIAVCMLISLLVALTGKGIWIFTKENIDKTYIFSLLANLKLL